MSEQPLQPLSTIEDVLPEDLATFEDRKTEFDGVMIAADAHFNRIAEALRPIIAKLTNFRDRIAAMEIGSQQDRDEMTAGIRVLSKAKTKLTDLWKPITSAPHELHRKATSALAAMTKIIDEAKATANQRIGTYDAEQRRIAAEEALKRQREEQQRMEAERLATAERLEAQGHKAAADAVLEAPMPAVVMPVPQDTRSPGERKRTTWQWRVVDTAAIPQEYYKMVLDVDKIVATVKSLKGDARIPGIEVYPETTSY